MPISTDYIAVETTIPAEQPLPPPHTQRLYRSAYVLGGISFLVFVVLGVVGYRMILSGQELLTQHALLQGYWIARALEMSHRVVPSNHSVVLRNIMRDIQRNAAVRQVLLLDTDKRVLMASDPSVEGLLWWYAFADPPEHGNVVHSARQVMDVVFPASFLGAWLGSHAHPTDNEVFPQPRWIVLQLDVSDAYAHYRAMVTQKVILAILMGLFGLSAFFFLGVMRRYTRAHAAIAHLERIKHHLARFVPATAQRLIEANPTQPPLDKVERHATVLFLDIEQYTRLAEALSPEALNDLIERYFSAFLDIILRCGGEINETTGDGLMAIFTADDLHTHARNATHAALAIRAQAERLNTLHAAQEPRILVNIGVCTGLVLLGATTMRTDTGQERLTYTASGMVTNMAARLCALAAHGAIYLGETTAHLVRHEVALAEPTSEHLKNISGEIQIYRIV